MEPQTRLVDDASTFEQNSAIFEQISAFTIVPSFQTEYMLIINSIFLICLRDGFRTSQWKERKLLAGGANPINLLYFLKTL